MFAFSNLKIIGLTGLCARRQWQSLSNSSKHKLAKTKSPRKSFLKLTGSPDHSRSSKMKVINKKFSTDGFIKYLVDLPKPWRHVDKLVFHHTSSPVETWKGSASMLHYYNLYKSRGWKTGPHIFIAPDGIWLFTPMSKQGTHAGPEGNAGSIGIEIVGRYFDAPPTDLKICEYIALVTHMLFTKFNLNRKSIYNHTHYDPDTFCSPLLTEDWIMTNYYRHLDWLQTK